MKNTLTLEEALNVLAFADDFDEAFIHDEDSFWPMEIDDEDDDDEY